MLNDADVLSLLNSQNLTEEATFELMATITSLVNDYSTHDRGREFVIRALANRSHIPPAYHELLNELVQSTGLLPYAEKPSTLEASILREAHSAPGLGGGAVFHSLQLQVYKLLMAKRNVILSATTSVGKSMVVDAIIASDRYRKIVVIVPTIALIDETRRRIAKRFAGAHRIITHPSQVSDPEIKTIFILTQERVLSRSDLHDVDFFVVDEFYKLDLHGDVERSVDLNLAFHKLASSGAQFYLIGPHIAEIRGLAESYSHVFIPSRFSTVALDVHVFNLPQHGGERREKLVALMNELDNATMVYCQSPNKCGEVAEYLIDSDVFAPVEVTSNAVSWLEQEFPDEWIVIRALRHGIGIHHGNVPRAIQQYLVRAFEQGSVKCLICTSTMIEGVNTVAENVIIYDRRLKASNINYFTFRNIAGRAGRMGRWFVGKVFVLESPPEEGEYSIELPLEKQDEKTPMSLILDLPDEKLNALSRNRIEGAVVDTTLSLTTIKANRHIPIDAQSGIAARISKDLFYREALNWSGMPPAGGLSAACELIYDYIDEGRSLKAYQIFSGQQLAAVLTRLAKTDSLKEFIKYRVANRRVEQSISESVENTLRLLRRYIGYTFARQLVAIERIHADVLARVGHRSSADYKYYAARAESLFMESGLFALDEYGVPPQTARRLGLGNSNIDTLEKALELVRSLDLSGSQLHPFERELLSELVAMTAA